MKKPSAIYMNLINDIYLGNKNTQETINATVSNCAETLSTTELVECHDFALMLKKAFENYIFGGVSPSELSSS